MQHTKDRDLGLDQRDLPNLKSSTSDQHIHSSADAASDKGCGVQRQDCAKHVPMGYISSLDSPELAHLNLPAKEASTLSQRPSSVDDGLSHRKVNMLKMLSDVCDAEERPSTQLIINSSNSNGNNESESESKKSQSSSNSFARSLAQSSQCSEEQLLHTLSSFKIASPKLSNLSGFVSPPLQFNAPSAQQQQQQQQFRINSITPPFPPAYTPSGDNHNLLFPGYSLIQPCSTAFFTSQAVKQQQQQQQQQRRTRQKYQQKTQMPQQMTRQYSAQCYKMNKKLEQLNSDEHAALQEYQLSNIGDVDRAINHYFSFVPDFRVQSTHSSDQSIVFPIECSPYQGITKRCVYFPRRSVPPPSLMAFCSFGIAKVVRDSFNRDHRKFAYHAGDKLLVIGVKQDKSKMNMLQLLLYTGSSNIALSKRADVPPSDYVLETCANETIQGPFVVSRFGCVRINSQPPGVKETRMPDTVVFELVIDGLTMWVERSFIYTVGFRQDVEKIRLSDDEFFKCDELSIEDAPVRKRFADVVKRLAPVGPRLQIVKNPATFKSKILQSPKPESPQKSTDDVEPFNGTKRTRDKDACKDGKKKLGIELNNTPSPIIVPHSDESVLAVEDSHDDVMVKSEPSDNGGANGEGSTKSIPISMLLL